MTDMEILEENNEKSSDFAKLRASLKEKYEGKIQELQDRIDSLEKSNRNTRKNFFAKSLKAEGYDGEDLDKFIEKYPSLEVDEVLAMYRGMNPKQAKIEETPSNSFTPQQEVPEERGSQSVLGTNPTAMSNNDDVSKMTGQEYLNYLKKNMSQLGLE